MMKNWRKRTTGKTTSKIQALDDEALKGIVGGTAHDNEEDEENDDMVFYGESSGPNWNQDS